MLAGIVIESLKDRFDEMYGTESWSSILSEKIGESVL
jgi:hypothetical protein